MFGLSTTMLVGTVLAVLLGGVAATVIMWRFSKTGKRITGTEFAACTVALILVFVPLVSWTGGKIARSSSVGGYQEYWNGSITAAKSQAITCTRDGSCVHEYDCDPYQRWEVVRYDTQYYTDSQGKQQSRQVPVYDWVTHYHSCPYATHEYDYWLADSFGGNHTVASHIFAINPAQWRGGHGLPSGVERGIPAEWQAAKASLDAGDAPPATKLNSYTNYLLAAQGSILSAYSDSIEKYRKMGLLPRYPAGKAIYGGYQADKMVFAGFTPTSGKEWQQALGRLDSYLGSQLQGDLHILAVPGSRISDPADYANAVLAYWQSRQMGKNALAKNAIMVVVGVSDDGRTITWAQAKTGIPEGNGEMLSALSSRLAGTAFDPKTMIGWPKARVNGDKLSFTPSTGAIEQIVMRDYPFARPCMDCKDKGDKGSGYVYLRSSAYISTGAQLGVMSVLFVLGMATFTLAAWFDFGRIIPATQNGWRSLRQTRNKRTTW